MGTLLQDKIDAGAFARDWNAGMTRPELAKKYGVRTPEMLAHQLRRRGMDLVKRYPGWEGRQRQAVMEGEEGS